MDLWSEAELQALLCGTSPNGTRESSRELNDAAEQIRRAVLAEQLPFIAPIDPTAGDKLYSHHRFFKPAHVIAWAGNKFPKFPFKNEKVPKVATEKSLDKRERETMIKIIHALAKNGYKYPSHGALNEIMKDFQLHGNGVASENTLTKYLKDFEGL